MDNFGLKDLAKGLSYLSGVAGAYGNNTRLKEDYYQSDIDKN